MKKLVLVLMAMMLLGTYTSCGHQTQAVVENDTIVVDSDSLAVDTFLADDGCDL